MTEQLGCLSPSHRRENLKGAAECGNGIPDFGFTGNPFYHHQIIKKLPTTALWRVPSNESAPIKHQLQHAQVPGCAGIADRGASSEASRGIMPTFSRC